MIKKTAAAGIIIFALFVFACDYDATGDRLNGVWIAESGAKFTFDNSNFTRFPLFGPTETGTYTANNGLIKLSRYGAFVDVSLEYSLQFPYLTIDDVKYTSALSVTPPSPPSIDGYWVLPPMLFATAGFDIIFEDGERKGDGIQGNYDMRASFKGIYNTRRDLVSNTDKLTMTPTHVHGTYLKDFLYSLPISLYSLFDIPEAPPFTQGDSGIVWGYFPWWYTPDEVMKYFKDAENKATTLAMRSELAHARSDFFKYFEPGNFNYSLEFITVFPDDLNQDQFVTSGAKNQLTLISNATGVISIFYRFKPDAIPKK